MDLQGKITLAYLEEDNTQTGLFRMRPLLNQDGIRYENAEKNYPDDGYLRIVPDKNEQHTFRSRMRDLKPLCALDLRNKPQGKVRKNRNYRPEKMETNQYVVYSNALCACPENMCYQVVPEGKLTDAMTPLIYIRKGAVIRGPYLPSGEQAGAGLHQLAPDCRELYTLSLPDSREILMYWAMETPAQPESPEKPIVKQEQEQTEEKTFENALDQIQSLNSQLTVLSNPLKAKEKSSGTHEKAQPVGKGTPLYAAQVSVPEKKSVANPLARVVDAKRRASKKNPPEEENALPSSEAAVQDSISPEMQPQITQLQDLEAERLRLLMQLEDVRKNSEVYKQQLFEKLEESKKEQISALDEVILTKKNMIESLSGEQQAGFAHCSDMLRELLGIQNARAGKCDDPEMIIDRVLNRIREAGFTFTKNEAAALLTGLSLSVGSIGFGLTVRSTGDAVLAAEALCSALGAPLLRSDTVSRIHGDSLTGVYSDRPEFLQGDTLIRFFPMYNFTTGTFFPDLYLREPMIVFPLHTDQRIPEPVFDSGHPQSASWLISCFAKCPSLSIREQEWLLSISSDFNKHGIPLPLSVLRLMARMIGSLREYMTSNPSDAYDFAFLCCALPYLKLTGKSPETVRPLITALPRTLREWSA